MQKRTNPSSAFSEPKRSRLPEPVDLTKPNQVEEFDELSEEHSEASSAAADESPANQPSTNAIKAIHSLLSSYLPTPEQFPALPSHDWTQSMFTLPAEEHYELFKPQDLQQELPLHHVIGLNSVKDILMNTLLPALRYPSAYEFGTPNRAGQPVQHNFYFHGRHGSGIRTLVRSFCAAAGLNLVIAAHPAFDARTDLTPLYELARANKPCVVLLVGAEVQFGVNSPNVTALAAILESIQRSAAPVWTLFRAENHAAFLAPQLQELLDYNVWCGVPDSWQRVQLLALGMQQFMPRDPKTGEPVLPERSLLLPLAAQSEFCTARNIIRCIRASYAHKLAKLNAERAVLTAERLAFTVNDIEVLDIPAVGRRLTTFDPKTFNVDPFVAFVPISNEQQQQQRR